MVAAEKFAAIYRHSCKVYDAMLNDPDTEEVPNDEGGTYHVYTGYLTKLFIELELSVPYYSDVMNMLKQMDCCRQVKRGGGSAPSVWLLLRPPSEELFNNITMTTVIDRIRTKANADDATLQMINDLNERIRVLEEAIFNAQA